MQWFRFVVVLVLASAVTGCFLVTTSSSFTQKELTKKAEVAVATPTTRADVRKLLGEPWIASERWRVEVYRRTGNYRELLVMFGLLPFPIPAPIPLPKEDLTGYTLVSYSAADVVEAVDTAISKYPNSPFALMQAGDFAFMEENAAPGTPNGTASQALIVSHERFAASRMQADVNSCTVLVGCSPCKIWDTYSIQMQLDDDPSTRYVPSTFGSHRKYPFVPLTPIDGEHTLHFSQPALEGEIKTQFSCPSPELRYAHLILVAPALFTWENVFSLHLKLIGTVQMSNEVPASLKDSGVLLWTNGRWLVDR